MSTKIENFLPSTHFVGRKVGYVFQNGERGIGYYPDSVHKQKLEEESILEKKRKFREVEEDDAVTDKARRAVASSSSSNVNTEDIEDLLEQGEQADITQLDASSLKQMLVNLEKKITKNQKMRVKYPEDPEKFMESEFELHKEIQDLHVVAASPELYPIIISNNSINSILGLITHENTDISIATISLLQEMTDVDTILEEYDIAQDFVQHLIKGQGLELLVQNLQRLDESQDEDAQAVYNTLAIVEHIVEITPSSSIFLCEKTYFLHFLLHRLKAKAFDANKLYCSEILSIVLQSESKNQYLLCHLPTPLGSKNSAASEDGLELLLQCLAVYRKKAVDLADEQECVENLCLSLCSVLMLQDNQLHFLQLEGFELLQRCLAEQQYIASCMINVMNYGIMKNTKCCERLIDAGGMKYVFPLLMGKGMKKSLLHKKRSASEGDEKKKGMEETVISILAQLCMQLHDSTSDKEYPQRITLKFIEHSHEKLLHCCHLYQHYMKALEKTEEEIDLMRQTLRGDELEAFEDEDNLYIMRLDGGLFVLQQLAIILAYVCAKDRQSLSVVHHKLLQYDMSLVDVLGVIRDVLTTLEDNQGSAVDQTNVSQGFDAKDRAVLESWSTTIAAYIESNP